MVETNQETAEQAQEREAAEKAAREEAGRIKMERDDMYALGMSEAEIEAELAKSKSARDEESKKKAEEAAAVKPKETEKPREKEEKADVIKDMIFKAERENAAKAQQEAAAKLAAERRAKMTAEELAAENQEISKRDAEIEASKIEVFTLKQNNAFEAARASMPAEEWELISKDIKEYIESDSYVKDISLNVDPTKLAAEIVAKAKGLNTDKLVEMRLKKAEKERETKKQIENLHDFGGGHMPTDKTASKSELDVLQERALKGELTTRETERMLYLEDIAEQKARTK